MTVSFVSFSDASHKNKLKTTLENIKNQAPAYATAFYLVGKDLIPQGTGLLVWAIIALVVGIFFEVLAKKSTAAIISAAIAFVFWIYGMGGPLEGLIPDFFGTPPRCTW